MPDTVLENSQIAVSTQQKFEAYALALTFAILGLSVQTNSMGRVMFADALEIGAWLALLTSGLMGLSRWEGISRIYDLHGHSDRYEERAKGVRKAMAQGAKTFFSLEDGNPIAAEAVLANAESSLRLIEDHLKPAEEQAVLKYRWQKRLFVTGVILLVAGRAYVPLARIARTLFG